MKNSFFKQLVVFVLVFIGTCAVINVDMACSATMERSPLIGITLKKISEDTINATGFGRSFNIDRGLIEQQWDQMKENGKNLKEYKDQLFAMFRQ